MKISVLGAGNIGGTLGGKWAAAGHEVVFGVRDPQAEKVQLLLAKAGNGATAVPVPAAAAGADVVVFAVPGGAMGETAVALGSKLNGKILVDTANLVGQTPMNSLSLLRQAAPASPLFRAFSNLGWENFADPVIDGVQVDLFYCGDGGDGQTAVHTLIADIGLRPVYLGGVDQADLVDSLTRLWFVLALQRGYGRHLAFKLMG
ncbi:MAG: NAD(P)-binding domain-containing protein [Chloroflexi bacterium]|nr:NAD(P)-binding domain-containing protein [Chloroflexota bacterium]MBP7044482.1 NAD(P)-binding domain-containing protein [Chloroflexota bacterium]